MYIDTTIYEGRPVDESGRSPAELKCYDFLDSLEMSYQRIDHEPTDTMEACREVKKLLGLDVCKNLFLTNRSGKELYLLLMPGDKPFRTSVVSKLIGTSRLSFGKPEKMEELLHTHPGSASILGLMFDKDKTVRLIIDSDVLKNDHFGCHPCMNTSSIRMSTADLLYTVLPALGHEPTIIDIPYQNEDEMR